jgi:glyoxylase-like metal-dependent hydrolase (beta-lactamase superfamily II)
LVRRRLLIAAAGLAVATPAFAADAPAVSARAGDGAGPARVPTPVALGGGAYLLQGSGGEPDADNLGRIGNTGFIVGDTGVLVIDVGTSARHGEAILAAIASVTDKPVRLALVTHVRQEFVFGAAAFRRRGIPIRMHRRAAQLMAARCEGCLKTLRKLLGEPEMDGSTMFEPDAVFDDAFAIDGNEGIGRRVRVLYFGHSSGPGDIAVFDERSGVLFGGGLVDVDRIPDVQDGRLPEWHDALRALGREPVRRVVGGHGPAAPAAAIAAADRYLDRLETRVRALLAADTPLSEVADRSDLPEYAAFDAYDTIHRRNASVLFVRLEYDVLFGKPASGVPR